MQCCDYSKRHWPLAHAAPLQLPVHARWRCTDPHPAAMPSQQTARDLQGQTMSDSGHYAPAVDMLTTARGQEESLGEQRSLFTHARTSRPCTAMSWIAVPHSTAANESLLVTCIMRRTASSQSTRQAVFQRHMRPCPTSDSPRQLHGIPAHPYHSAPGHLQVGPPP